MKIIIFFFLILFLYCPISNSKEIDSNLNLQKAIDISLEKNPQLKIALAQVDIKKATVKDSKSKYFPQIEARLIVPFIGRESGFFLNQLIWDFGRTSNLIKAAKAELQSSKYSNDLSTQNIILKTITSYYTVLTVQQDLQSLEKSFEEQNLKLIKSKALLELGRITNNDLVRSELDVANSKIELINAKNNLETAKLNLMNIMGLDHEFEFKLDESAEYELIEIDLNDSINYALQKRPDLKALSANQKAAESNLYVSKKEFYPRIWGRTAYRFEGEGATTPAFIVGVGLSFPIFNGFSRFAKLDETRAKLKQARLEIETSKTSVVSEIKELYSNIKVDEEKISLTKISKTSAEKNFELSQERYNLGRASSIELSVADAMNTSAKSDYLKSVYDYKIAVAKFKWAVGKINEYAF